jgi:hypothetical protein
VQDVSQIIEVAVARNYDQNGTEDGGQTEMWLLVSLK